MDLAVEDNLELRGSLLRHVRYDLLAQALGLHAERVTDVDRLPSALAEAIANAPALLDVRTSREVPLPDFTSGLADLRGLPVLAGRDDAERALRNTNEGAAP